MVIILLFLSFFLCFFPWKSLVKGERFMQAEEKQEHTYFSLKKVMSHLCNFIGKINMQGYVYISLNLLLVYIHTVLNSCNQCPLFFTYYHFVST